MTLQVLKTENLLNPSTWQVMNAQATVLVKSGCLPTGINTPEKAIAIMMKRYELGVPPMQAFAHISIVNGRPTLSAELMLAQIYKLYPHADIKFVRMDNEGCEIHAKRPGDKEYTIFKFDQNDAKLAGLLGKDNWKKYPRAMYKARCISEMARTKFPEALMGCGHTAEELNPDLEVNEDGEVIEIKYEEKPKLFFDKENKSHVDRLDNILKEIYGIKDAKPNINNEDKIALIEFISDKDLNTHKIMDLALEFKKQSEKRSDLF